MNRPNRTLHDWAYAALIGAIAAVLLLSTPLANAAAAPTAMDAQALSDVARSNKAANEASIAGSRASMCTAISNSDKCTSAECHIAVKAIAALSAACGNGGQPGLMAAPVAASPAPVIVQAAPPQPEPHIAWRIVGGIGSLFGQAIGMAINNAPQILGQYAQMRLGIVNSNNQMALGIAQSNNGLAAQQSTNTTILGLGNGIVATADSGFRTTGGMAGAFAARPTNSYLFSGNNNQFAGGNLTINTETNTVSCPQNTQATGGNAAPGGQGGSAVGANGGASGNSAPPSTNPVASCTAGK